MANPFKAARKQMRPGSQKSVTPGQLLGLGASGVPQLKEWDTSHAIREGFKKSHVLYAAIRRISTAAASVGWVVTEGVGNEAEDNPDHPLTKLLERPNPYTSGQDLIERATTHLYLGGNAILTKIRASRRGPVEELWTVMPDRVTPVPAERGFLEHYEVKAADGRRLPDMRPEDVCHLMFVDPANDYWGMSPVQAGAQLIDTDVTAVHWNRASLQARAVPDGVLSTDQQITDEQYERLSEQVRGRSGPDNARQALILEAGLNWQQMSLSPAEMDFIESRKLTREDLLALVGCPPGMLGIVQSATQSDLDAMRQQFWVDTVIPLLRDLEAGFNLSLAPEWGPEVRLRFRIEDVEELKTSWSDKILSASRLHYMGVPLAEISKILELGLDEDKIPSADEAFVPSDLVPADRAGQQTDADVIARILGRDERRNGHD